MFLCDDCLVQGLRFRSALKSKCALYLTIKSKASPRPSDTCEYQIVQACPPRLVLPRLIHSAWSQHYSIEMTPKY